LAIDRTASSNAFQQGVLQAAVNLFEALEKKSVAVEVWVQTHGDLDEGQLPLLICGGSDTATALSEIAGITYEGGGLPPENHLDAIESLLNSAPWGSGGPSCRDVIILLCTGPSKPAQSGVSPQDLAVRLKDLNILLAVVAEPVDPGIHSLCGAANAEFEPISNSPDKALMQRIGFRLASSILAPVAATGTIAMR
jgi:hypothetical protein